MVGEAIQYSCRGDRTPSPFTKGGLRGIFPARATTLTLLFLLQLAGLTRADSPTPITPDTLQQAAITRTSHRVLYDGSYQRLAYPGGDVAADRGVCTDVIIRSYRALGVDLQQRVHEDMQHHFSAYPSQKLWGLTRPDSNIDHRRVPNLQTFFSRHGQSLVPSQTPSNYQPGDLVTWMLPGNLPHIGIVVAAGKPGQNPEIVHNIGAGPQREDVLFQWPITGHYRYLPEL